MDQLNRHRYWVGSFKKVNFNAIANIKSICCCELECNSRHCHWLASKKPRNMPTEILLQDINLYMKINQIKLI